MISLILWNTRLPIQILFNQQLRTQLVEIRVKNSALRTIRDTFMSYGFSANKFKFI